VKIFTYTLVPLGSGFSVEEDVLGEGVCILN